VALEEDNYDAFPSATFVSGYLRSYARILGLAEEDFVRPLAASIEPPSIVTTIGSKEQASSRDLPVRLVTYLLIIAVIVSVAMWWLAQRNSNSGAVVAPAEEAALDSEGTLSLPPVQESLGEEGETAPAAGDGAEAESDSHSDTAEQGGDEAASEVSPAEPAVEEATSEAPRMAQSAPQTGSDSEASTDDEPPAPPPLTDAMPKSRLELRYQADSWTEVNDSAGRNLVYGLIQAGQVLELRGEAPFRVFLGYAPGVTVYYNGDLFDHSPFQRRDVARFRIGRAEHNLPGPR
jgi:cytoskeleton protein RodZ